MKNQIIIRNNQSLFDIAIETTGVASNALSIAKANDLEPTEVLKVGNTLIIPESLTKDTAIKDYYSQNDIHPATGLTKSEIDIIDGLQGIGYWVIDNNFEVTENNEGELTLVRPGGNDSAGVVRR